MGQGMSFDLTQQEIEDLQQAYDYKFSQTEIQILYKRFLKLDKDKKGFISPEELLAIPEFSLNPLAHRLVSVFENVNFKDFLQLLSAFSAKASKEEKLKFMFNFHDVDGDGYISRLDLEHILQQVCDVSWRASGRAFKRRSQRERMRRTRGGMQVFFFFFFFVCGKVY